MTGLNTILAATDLSSNSAPALERGALIAKAAGARFDVMHAIGRGVTGALREFLGDKAETISTKLADKARAQLAEMGAGGGLAGDVSAEVHVETGPAAKAISACAQSLCADLIVLGANGGSFLSGLMLGSTTSRVIHDSGGRPVLVVKEKPRGAYERVLVAVDFSPVSRTAIELARQTAPGAHIVLMHVFDEPEFEETMEDIADSDFIAARYKERAADELNKLASGAGLSLSDYTPLVVRGDARREIVDHEDKLGCDLVILGKHGSHVTEELLLGSVANGVLIDSRRDVLVVVDGREPPLLAFSGDRPAAARLLQADRFDVSNWSAGEADPLSQIVSGATGEAIVRALRDAFSRENAFQFEFGATIVEPEIDARPTDLVMTLPFTKEGEAWLGPLLVISLENIVQRQIDALDMGDGALVDPESMAQLRNGLHALANRINSALSRNVCRIARYQERRAPLWV